MANHEGRRLTNRRLRLLILLSLVGGSVLLHCVVWLAKHDVNLSRGWGLRRRRLRGESSCGGGGSHDGFSPSHHSSTYINHDHGGDSRGFSSSSQTVRNDCSSSGGSDPITAIDIIDVTLYIVLMVYAISGTISWCCTENSTSTSRSVGITSTHHHNTNTRASNDNQSYETFNPSWFEASVRDAKRKVESCNTTEMTAGKLDNRHPKPYSGYYESKYADQRTPSVQPTTTLNLQFTPDEDIHGHPRGFNISGFARDIDGNAIIKEGYANYNGEAWWRDRTISGNVGFEVLSRGVFDFEERTFKGTWLANSGEQGSYLTFYALPQASTTVETTLNGPENGGCVENIAGAEPIAAVAVADRHLPPPLLPPRFQRKHPTMDVTANANQLERPFLPPLQTSFQFGPGYQASSRGEEIPTATVVSVVDDHGLPSPSAPPEEMDRPMEMS